MTEMFHVHGVCTITLLRNQLQTRLSDDSSANPLFRASISDDLFTAVLNKIAMPLHSAWVLKERPELGSAAIRAAVIETFRGHTSMGAKEAREEVSKRLHDRKPDPQTLAACFRELTNQIKQTLVFKTGDAAGKS
jgi:hypothetical protein